MKRGILFISLFLILNLTLLSAQEKYQGQFTDCDPALMPSVDSYKIIYDTTAFEARTNSEETSISLPCEVYYQIKERQKDTEPVVYKPFNAIIILIYPKNRKLTDKTQ